MTVDSPSLEHIRVQQQVLGRLLEKTPLVACPDLAELLPANTRVFAKLEFLQRTGTFKARGALSVLKSLKPEQLARGVTAVSAGNHAIATAFAAQMLGISAKVVMTRSANPARVAACRSFGGDIVFADTVHEAFALAEDIRDREQRILVHPFEGPDIATGTATLGLEICDQLSHFDAIIVSVGGGGLLAGISTVVRQCRPDCEIIGVEPVGADSMSRSFTAGQPQAIDAARSIADSLGAPFAAPYSFELCHRNVDRIVLVEDLEIQLAMGTLFQKLHIAVEPACAASTAALLGPLRQHMVGKTVVLVLCGSNIDAETYTDQVRFPA